MDAIREALRWFLTKEIEKERVLLEYKIEIANCYISEHPLEAVQERDRLVDFGTGVALLKDLHDNMWEKEND